MQRQHLRIFENKKISAYHGQCLTFWTVIVRHFPITVQSDPNLPALLWFELFTIKLDCVSMRNDQTVAYSEVSFGQNSNNFLIIKFDRHPRLSGRIAFRRSVSIA